MPKSLLLSLLLASVFAQGVGQAANQTTNKPSSLVDSIKLVSPSVVQITYEMDQFPEETASVLGTTFFIGPAGTGFIVNEEGYVVTALHVLSFFGEFHGFPLGGRTYPAGRNRLLIGIPYPNIETKTLEMRGSFSMVPFTVVDTDPVHDLALLKPQRRLPLPGGGNMRPCFRLLAQRMESDSRSQVIRLGKMF
jgi:hypothetical protein